MPIKKLTQSARKDLQLTQSASIIRAWQQEFAILLPSWSKPDSRSKKAGKAAIANTGTRKVA